MSTNIVPTNIEYSSYLLRQNLNNLNRIFPFLNIQTVGRSVLGQNIYVIKLGNGPKKVFYSGGIHANEWITSVLLMKFIENYCNAYVNDEKLYNYSVRDLFRSCSIYIMPMVNPDGVNLVTGNLPTTSSSYISAQNIALSFPDIPFPSGWKANINGVDFSNFQHTLLINRLDWRYYVCLSCFQNFFIFYFSIIY